MSARAATLVVVSYYDRRTTERMERLIASLTHHPAGAPFDVTVVANRTSDAKLAFPGDLRVLERENTGMNIGAWDHGWRASPGYDSYLFLQDECFAVRDGWLAAFQAKTAEAALIGESFNPAWNSSWLALRQAHAASSLPDHTIDGAPAPRVEVYLDFMRRIGVDPGETGRHLRSLIWFAKRETLEAIGGFPIGANYGECIAAEIAVSRKLEALGKRIAQIASEEPFRYFRHLEYNRDHPGAPYTHKRLGAPKPYSARRTADANANATSLAADEAAGKTLFRVHSASPLLASTRYRALMPALGLESLGIRTSVTDGPLSPSALSTCRAIVFAKAFRPADMALAFEAHRLGTPIVLDICDDMFIPEYGEGKGALYTATFQAMSRLASVIVTTGPALRDTISALAPETLIKIIPDQLETPDVLSRVLKRPDATARRASLPERAAFALRDPRGALRRLRARLATHAPVPLAPTPTSNTSQRTIIWFGNHGAEHSAFGLSALAPVKAHLATVARDHSIKLLIVSNSREKYTQMFAAAPYPTEYREWSATRIFADLDGADICLIPMPQERFALAKSANRVALALSRGAAVIADDFPALAPFAACIVRNDWAGGLARYLNDEPRRQADIACGQEVIASFCSPVAVARSWADLIENLPRRTGGRM